jgi:hypothetical protein
MIALDHSSLIVLYLCSTRINNTINSLKEDLPVRNVKMDECARSAGVCKQRFNIRPNPTSVYSL